MDFSKITLPQAIVFGVALLGGLGAVLFGHMTTEAAVGAVTTVLGALFVRTGAQQ